MFGEKHKDKFGSIFLRLKTGDTVTLVPVGEERAAKTKWDGTRTVECYWDPEHDKPNKVAFNAWLPDEGKLVIMEGPGSFYRDLIRAKIEEGEIVFIERTGGGKSTRFEITKQGKMPEEEWNKVCAMNQHDLTQLWKAPEAEGEMPEAPSESKDPESDIPF